MLWFTAHKSPAQLSFPSLSPSQHVVRVITICVIGSNSQPDLSVHLYCIESTETSDNQTGSGGVVVDSSSNTYNTAGMSVCTFNSGYKAGY